MVAEICGIFPASGTIGYCGALDYHFSAQYWWLVTLALPHSQSDDDSQPAHGIDVSTWPTPGFIDRNIHADYAVNPMRNMRGINLEPHLPNIHCPTLVIWGERDPFTPRRQAQRIVNRVPQTELVILEKTGHFPMWENPAYHTTVLDWL